MPCKYQICCKTVKEIITLLMINVIFLITVLKSPWRLIITCMNLGLWNITSRYKYNPQHS